MVNVFITNLGKYNEGYGVLECGKWLSLPQSEEDIKEALKSIEVEDNTQYEEYFITDFETDIPDFKVGEYCNIFKLSEMLEELESLDKQDVDKVYAMLEAGVASGIQEALDYQKSYSLYTEIKTAYEAGEFLLQDSPIPPEVRDYVDYERYYNDVSTNSSYELTSYGLLMGDY